MPVYVSPSMLWSNSRPEVGAIAADGGRGPHSLYVICEHDMSSQGVRVENGIKSSSHQGSTRPADMSSTRWLQEAQNMKKYEEY